MCEIVHGLGIYKKILALLLSAFTIKKWLVNDENHSALIFSLFWVETFSDKITMKKCSFLNLQSQMKSTMESNFRL